MTLFTNGPRHYLPVREPMGVIANEKEMLAYLPVPTKTFGVELLPGHINEVKIFAGKDTYIVDGIELTQAIQEALGLQRRTMY